MEENNNLRLYPAAGRLIIPKTLLHLWPRKRSTERSRAMTSEEFFSSELTRWIDTIDIGASFRTINCALLETSLRDPEASPAAEPASQRITTTV